MTGRHRRRPTTVKAPLLVIGLLLAAGPAAAQEPSGARAGAAKTPAGRAAVPAKAPAAPKQGGGAQTQGQPIEIVADNLVVQQADRIALFSGHVDAKQGSLRLRADQLKVFYNDPKAQAAAGGQQVRLIEAMGNVLLVQGGGTAQGDHGTYRVAERLVTMDGNVVLTQGQNVVRGARLDSDLNTGVSKVFAAGEGGQPGTAPQGRVRAFFAPSEPAGSAGGKPQPGSAKPAGTQRKAGGATAAPAVRDPAGGPGPAGAGGN